MHCFWLGWETCTNVFFTLAASQPFVRRRRGVKLILWEFTEMSWYVPNSPALEAGRDFKEHLHRSLKFLRVWPGRSWELAHVFRRDSWWGTARRSALSLGTVWRHPFCSSAGQCSGLPWPHVPVPDQRLASDDWLAHTLQQAEMITTSCFVFKPCCFGCWPRSSPFAKRWRSCGRVKISVLRATPFAFPGKAFEFTVWLWLFHYSGIAHSHQHLCVI